MKSPEQSILSVLRHLIWCRTESYLGEAMHFFVDYFQLRISINLVLLWTFLAAGHPSTQHKLRSLYSMYLGKLIRRLPFSEPSEASFTTKGKVFLRLCLNGTKSFLFYVYCQSRPLTVSPLGPVDGPVLTQCLERLLQWGHVHLTGCQHSQELHLPLRLISRRLKVALLRRVSQCQNLQQT